jgi:hypothetical protein
MSENDKLAALLGSAYLLKKADDKIDSLERKILDVNNTKKKGLNACSMKTNVYLKILNKKLDN